MTRRHIDDLFTAAHDDELSPIDDARFHAHLRSCKDCAAAFAEFAATVEALHELPKARMARVVHLPSTPPVAELSPGPRISFGWLNGGLLRRFPATAVAGAAAAVLIIIALVHNGGNVPTSTGSNAGRTAAVAPGASSRDAACTQPITTTTGTSLPVSFALPQVVTDPKLPGARLVLAASSISVTSGENVTVYAQLSLPLSSLGAPAAAGAQPATRTVRPCVSVGVGGSNQNLSLAAGGANGAASGPGGAIGVVPPAPLSGSTGTAPLLTFTVPSNLAPGTQLHVVASIPAGFEGPNSPALTATLTLTTH
jgi:Putative zinc-finger